VGAWISNAASRVEFESERDKEQDADRYGEQFKSGIQLCVAQKSIRQKVDGSGKTPNDEPIWASATSIRWGKNEWRRST